MKKLIGLSLLALGMGLPCWFSAAPSYGVPGYSVDEVKTWMQGHPTLRADRREGLRVHRADVPSRRFTFQASVFPIGGLGLSSNSAGQLSSSSPQRDLSKVRREEFILVDYDEPVSLERLEDALRTLYGPDMYADYRRARATYEYSGSVNNRLQGEVRVGNLYAYWIELTSDTNGVVTTGKLNVILTEDVDHLQSYLQQQVAFSY